VRIHFAAKVVALAVLFSSAPTSAKEVTVRSIDALKKALYRAEPGTAVLIAPGTYRAPKGRKVFYLGGVKGTAKAPIEIRAADPKNPPIFRAGNECFHLNRCSYIVVDGIICEGAHVNNMQFDFCDHLVVKNCVSRNMAATLNNQNCDGIKMPGTREFLFYNCTVETWGFKGSAVDMVGCARGLIARCRFSYPKLTGGGANCTQPKSGTFGIGIYKCRFDDASLRAVQFGGAGSPRHLGAKSRQSGLDQVAMGNVIVSGECPVVFACASDCVFAYNTIVRPGGYVVRVLKEGDYKPMSNNRMFRNLIVYDRRLIFLQNSRGTFPKAVSWVENYWYNRADPSRSIPKLPVPEKSPAGGRDPRLDKSFVPAGDGPATAYGAATAALDAAWAKHTDKFKWAWEQARELERAAKQQDTR